MKKIVSVLLSIVMLVGLSATLLACNKTPRDEILKLYMPGEYIDEDIFEEFEAWYQETYGKKITVQVDPFDAVEDVQLAVEGSRADFDLLCPSDYMVEYLISKNLVLESGMDISADGLFRSEYVETTRQFDPTLKYAVPYMYGTLGLVYDITKTGRQLDSWEDLFGNDFSGKRSVKDSIRDAYAAACLYNARSETAGLTGEALKTKIQSIFMDTSASTVANAKSTLLAVKNGSVWDIDNVKYEMASGQTDVAVALMWSCDAGYVMNDYEDEDGNEHEGNRNLWYVVPKEGGNVYIDAFVISKYAVNVEGARAFLQFLCRQDIAVKNSEYAGAISPVAAAYDELYTTYTEDEDGLFSEELVNNGWKAMFIETMFPSATTLNRCGVMKDFGSGKSAVTDMWSSIQ